MTAEAAVPRPPLSPEVTARWQARFRAPRVSPAGLGAGRPAPQPLLLRRQRRRRAVRLGPGDRRAPPGHRPAQRHADRHAQPGRRDDLVVRRHRRRRVRRLADPAVRRRPGHRRRPRGRSRPTRRGSRSAARWSRSAARPTTAASCGWRPSGGTAAGHLPARRPRLGRRADPGRRAARHLALRARRPALPGAAGAAHATDDCGRSREKWDGEGRGLHALEFGPLPGDRRLLVGHERRGREELLIWDVAADTETEIVLDLPGDVTAELVPRRLGAAGRPRPRRPQRAVPLRPGRPARWRSWTPRTGVVRGATARPDGTVELAWSSSERPPVIRRADGPVVLSVTDEEPPAAYPVEDRWVPGPGGDVHALLVRPGGRRRRTRPAFLVHGGPEAADDDSYRARRAAYVDAGYAVVHVNYRGSTGYGSAWRDALTGRPGPDRARGRRRGLRRAGRRGRRRPAAGAPLRRLVGRLPHPARPRHPARALGGGHRRGAGRRLPRRLRGRDGGAAGLRPGAVRRLTGGGARRLRAVLAAHLRRRRRRAGARRRRRQRPALPDPADRQLPRPRWTSCGKEHEVYRFDAGHGSLVIEETIRQVEVALASRCGTCMP